MKCAIVGLGKVGMMFDSESKREGVWTHFRSFELLRNEGFDLVAVCDPDPKKLEMAKARQANLATYSTLAELLQKEKIDILTLASPTTLHAEQLQQSAGKVQGIFCEKPLAMTFSEAVSAEQICREKNTYLAVNYYKRWDLNFPFAKKLLEEGKIGKVNFASVSYTGPLDAVGSHAVDLLVFYFGKGEVKSTIFKNEEMVSILEYPNFLAEVRQLGPREKFIFEVEILGDKGKIRIFDNGNSIQLFCFEKSERYQGYEELKEVTLNPISPPDRFLPLYRQLKTSIETKKNVMESDGASALAAQEILHKIELERK